MDGKSELDKPTQTEQENAEGKKLLELSEDDGEAQRKVERKKKFGKEAREWVILIAYVCIRADSRGRPVDERYALYRRPRVCD